MKKTLKIAGLFCIFCFMVLNLLSQEHTCVTIKEEYPAITPVGSAIAIPTKGWNYDSTLSTELDTIPYNGWQIAPYYYHQHADNGFSNDTSYWENYCGLLNLYLKNDTFIYQNPPDTLFYTSSILVNNSIDMSYGYYEIKVKLPIDSDLCSSFWSLQGADSTYREIDEIEFFTENMQTNVYHKYDSIMYGGKIYTDETLFNSTDWYVFGFEWLPKTYTFFINHKYIEHLDYDADCVEEFLAPIKYWRLWLVNWVGKTASPPFPKTLQADYVRIYNLKQDSINLDFYDNWSAYDYGTWKTIKLGDAYNATINDNGRHSIWATNGITLEKGFEVASGTEFETKIYKQ